MSGDHGMSVGNRIALWSLVATVLGTVVAVAAWLAPSDSGPAPSPTTPSAPAEASDDGPAPAPEADGDTGPTREDYVRMADDICHRWSIATGEAMAIPDDLARMREVQQILSTLVMEWRAVTPPAEDRATVDDIIDHYQAAADLGSDAIAAFERGDPATLQRVLTLLQEEQNAGTQKAREYGFRVC